MQPKCLIEAFTPFQALRRLFNILPIDNEEGIILKLHLNWILREEIERLQTITIEDTKKRIQIFRSKPAFVRELFFNLLRSPVNCISLTCIASIEWIENHLPEFTVNNELIFPDDISRLASLEEFINNKGKDKLIEENDRLCMARYLRPQKYKNVPGDTVFVSVNESDFKTVIEKLQWYIFQTPSIVDESIHKVVAQTLRIPHNIFSPDIDYLLEISNKFEKGYQLVYSIIISLIGCEGAGKTTLLQRLRRQKVEQRHESTETVQIHYSVFKMSNGFLEENKDGNETVIIESFNAKPKTKLKGRYILEAPSQPSSQQRTKKETDQENRRQKTIDNDNSDLKGQTSSSKNEKLFHALPSMSIRETFEGIYGRCNVFPLLSQSLKISDQHSIKITVQDFAGDSGIYICHPICLSASRVAILAIDISKSEIPEDFVTHIDLTKRWVESVHVHCGKDIPIILALTHADLLPSDQKINDAKEQLSNKIREWDISLLNHLSEERVVLVGLKSEEGISKLKKCILDVANSFADLKKTIPLSYEIYRNFLQDLQIKRKICELDAFVKEMEKIMPRNLHLSSQELDNMLKHFHDSKQILFYNEPHKDKFIVLDVQWFFDVFCKILLAKVPLLRLAKESRLLKLSGILCTSLLQEMCKDKLLEKDLEHFLQYLEITGFAVQFSRKNDKWYFPCMNVSKLPHRKMIKFSPTSTVCFLFDVLPEDIFSRLISDLIVNQNWRLMKDGDEVSIFKNAAFLTNKKNEIFLIGVKNTAIHVQGLTIEDVKSIGAIGCDVKINVERFIDRIVKKFYATEAQYSVAYKCKRTLFTDDSRTSLISFTLNEQNKHDHVLRCPLCPLEEVHHIDVREILQPWIAQQSPKVVDEGQRIEKQTQTQERQMSNALSNKERILELNDREEQFNFRHFRELTDLGIAALRKVFDSFIPPHTLQSFLNMNREWMTKGEFRFTKVEVEVLFPGNNQCSKSKDFDEGIMYKILRNAKSLKLNPPKKGWNKMPLLEDISPSDDIERFHQYRNDVSHSPEGSMKSAVFKIKSLDLTLALERIGGKEFKPYIEEVERRYNHLKCLKD